MKGPNCESIWSDTSETRTAGLKVVETNDSLDDVDQFIGPEGSSMRNQFSLAVFCQNVSTLSHIVQSEQEAVRGDDERWSF